jgi:hypothetical protein
VFLIDKTNEPIEKTNQLRRQSDLLRDLFISVVTQPRLGLSFATALRQCIRHGDGNEPVTALPFAYRHAARLLCQFAFSTRARRLSRASDTRVGSGLRSRDGHNASVQGFIILEMRVSILAQGEDGVKLAMRDGPAMPRITGSYEADMPSAGGCRGGRNGNY